VYLEWKDKHPEGWGRRSFQGYVDFHFRGQDLEAWGGDDFNSKTKAGQSKV